MMKNIKHIILFFTLIFSVAFSNKIAVATKVKGQVEIMAVGKKGFSDLRPGTILSD